MYVQSFMSDSDMSIDADVIHWFSNWVVLCGWHEVDLKCLDGYDLVYVD